MVAGYCRVCLIRAEAVRIVFRKSVESSAGRARRASLNASYEMKRLILYRRTPAPGRPG